MKHSHGPLSQDQIQEHNAPLEKDLDLDYSVLGSQLDRNGIDIEAVLSRVQAFAVAVPSWGAGKGGTRFARFPIAGEPTNVFERLEDCAIINQLSRATPRVSPHFPWDKVDDYSALKDFADEIGLAFDAVNSNTFQDQPDQAQTYEYGSLSATDQATREQAIAHNIECIEIGKALGVNALTVWVGDGTNFPGQQDLTRSFDRYLESASQVYAALPDDWRMLLEHKLFEPAFYSSVISDWGSSILAAQSLGAKCQCLVDLGHHAPNVNIEQIVSRLHRFGKLGGFHFNDSKYGDDDLDAGSINPYQLFLIFNELAEAELNPRDGFNPAYMIDQSHNVTDPIESMMTSADAILTAFAKAELVNREALRAAQESNDVMMATQELRKAYRVDVAPILAKARLLKGGAIDVIGAYRSFGWREEKRVTRKPPSGSSGIV